MSWTSYIPCRKVKEQIFFERLQDRNEKRVLCTKLSRVMYFLVYNEI